MIEALIFLIAVCIGAVLAGYAYRRAVLYGRAQQAKALPPAAPSGPQLIRIDPTEPVYTRDAVLQRIRQANPEIARDIVKAMHDNRVCTDTSHHYEITVIETFEGAIRRDGYCYDCKVTFVEDLP
jgi:hypothetical protein